MTDEIPFETTYGFQPSAESGQVAVCKYKVSIADQLLKIDLGLGEVVACYRRCRSARPQALAQAQATPAAPQPSNVVKARKPVHVGRHKLGIGPAVVAALLIRFNFFFFPSYPLLVRPTDCPGPGW